MRSLVLAFSVVSLTGSVSLSIAPQQHPQLAGHWVQDTPDPVRFGVGPTCGMDCVISQDEKTLTVKIGALAAASFTLDGKPKTTVASMGPYSAETTTMARWEGAVLVIVRSTTGGTMKQSTNRLSLRDGHLLIEASGSGRGSDGTKFVYRLVK